MNKTPSEMSLALSPSVPDKYQRNLLWINDQARSMGIHIQAGKGSGKSRLMGRIIAWLDFIRGVPHVIFDPHGTTIDNFLDRIVRQPKDIQEKLWPRILYVDMSGKSDSVIPFPLYYKLGGESLYEISQRFLDVIRKLDPFLQTASVEGWNPLWRTGTYTGMILAALGSQITEADQLLRNPLAWNECFESTLSTYPELRPAVSFFRELGDAKENFRARKTGSFSNKTALFSLDPSMQAIFGANKPGVDWNEVVAKRQTVLFDFRHEHDIERRRFKMMWAFNYFLDFVKHRGSGRHIPVGLIVDELTSLFTIQSMAADLFASDLDDLINVIARNYSIWLCIAHQELFQFSERLQKTLMTMGTQVLGVTSDPDAAETLSRQFFEYDPFLVKKYERVWMSEPYSPYVVDLRSVEFTPEEQKIVHGSQFKNQRCFQFLVRPAPGEGDTTGKLTPITIEGIDQGIFPDQVLVSEAREKLMELHGIPKAEILKELEARVPSSRISIQSPEFKFDEETEVSSTPLLWNDE